MHLHRQPNGKWRVQVRRKIDGEFVQKSKTFETKQEAEAWGHEMEAALSSSAMTLDQAFNLYIEEVMGERLRNAHTLNAKDSHKKRMNQIVNVQKHVGRHPVEVFGAPELKAFVDMRLKEVSPTTVKKEIYVVSAVYEYLIKDKLMTTLVNPARLIRMPQEPSGRKTVHRPEDRLTLTNALSGEPRDVYELLLETACRFSEIALMEHEWLDWQKYVINLPATATKARVARKVPMSRRAKEILSKYAEKESQGRVFKMQPDSIRKAYNRARKRVGLDHLRLHDCRHTKITALVGKAQNLFEVQQISGHASLKMLERYTHLEGDTLHHLMD